MGQVQNWRKVFDGIFSLFLVTLYRPLPFRIIYAVEPRNLEKGNEK